MTAISMAVKPFDSNNTKACTAKRILIAIFLLAFIFLTVSCRSEGGEAKSFSNQGFTITLDSSFESIANDSAVAFFANAKYSVICVKEGFDNLENGSAATLEQYAKIIKDKYPEYNAQIKSDGELIYLEYQNRAEHKDFYYNSYLFKSDSAFYTVHFATPSKDDNSQSHNVISTWAKTVVID